MSDRFYNNLDHAHEKVRLYNPRYLDRGGDHLVYELEGHPNIVVKASTYKIVDILSSTTSDDPTKLPKELELQLMEDIRVKNLQAKRLYSYFKADTILPERRCLTTVPITKRIIEELFSTDWKSRIPPPGYENLKEVLTIVIVQKKSEKVSLSEVASFHFGGLLEEMGVEASIVHRLNSCLLTGKVMSEEVLKEFLETTNKKGKSNLSMICSLLKEDGEFKIVFEDMIGRIIKFTNETGNILALAGRNNLAFFRDSVSGHWSYHLVDVLPIHSEDMFSLSKKLVLRLTAGETLSELERTILIKTVNFVRVINFFAKFLGVDEILEILPKDFDATTLASLVSKK